jgi:hypothetical protein
MARKTKLEKKLDKASSRLPPIVAVLIVVVMFFYTGIENIFSLQTMKDFGFNQYISNIIHVHCDTYCKTNTEFPVYNRILPAENIEKTNQVLVLKTGSRFKLKGYIAKEHVTWIAVKVYNSDKCINGYFLVPTQIKLSTFSSKIKPYALGLFGSNLENSFFTEISKDEENNFRNLLYDNFKKEAFKKFNISKAKDGLNIQKIEESKKYKIIPFLKANSGEAYYCLVNDYSNLDIIYNKYLGSNFDSNFLNLKSFFNK